MPKTFKGHRDFCNNAVMVDSREEPCDPSELLEKLDASYRKWEHQGTKCVSLRVGIKDAAWVPLLANDGYKFLHAMENYIVMYRELVPQDAVKRPDIPAETCFNCQTKLGVACVMFNDSNQILVVCNNNIERDPWIIPQIFVNSGENIKAVAAQRIKEESGIKANYVSMLTLRHKGYEHDDDDDDDRKKRNANTFIVVILRATTNKIIKHADNEENHRSLKIWMDVDDFRNHEYTRKLDRFLLRQAIEMKDMHLEIQCGKKASLEDTTGKLMTKTVTISDIKFYR